MFNPFYHSITRNMVIAFGDMFNGITLVRKRANGTEYERLTVPLEYGPKQKWWAVAKEDPTNLKTTRLILPRMGFEITSLQYDSTRQLNPIQKMVNTVEGDYKFSYVGTPYTFLFELNVMAINSDDGFQIIEQILPYFAPTQILSVNTLPLLAHKDDIPVTLISLQKFDDYEGSFEKLRIQTWSLAFQVRSYLYGPVTEAKLIRKAIVDLHAVGGNGPVTAEEIANTPRHVRITTEPDPVDAEPEDDYGFSITIEEFADNKRRDPVTGTDVLVDTDIVTVTGGLEMSIGILAPTVIEN